MKQIGLVQESHHAMLARLQVATLTKCGCPVHSAPPKAPEKISFPATEEEERPENWLFQYYSSSTFNRCCGAATNHWEMAVHTVHDGQRQKLPDARGHLGNHVSNRTFLTPTCLTDLCSFTALLQQGAYSYATSPTKAPLTMSSTQMPTLLPHPAEAHAGPSDHTLAWESPKRICVKFFVKQLGFESKAPQNQLLYTNFNTNPFGTPIS